MEKDFYLAEFIIDTLKLHNVRPVDEFIAIAGRNYGYATAYKIHGEPPYVVEYGDKGARTYAFCNDLYELELLLRTDGLSWLDFAIKMANLSGIKYIASADKADSGPFYIMITKHYHGHRDPFMVHAGTKITDFYRSNSSKLVKFERFSDAQGWIKYLELHRDRLEPNEAAYPIYKIISEQGPQ